MASRDNNLLRHYIPGRMSQCPLCPPHGQFPPTNGGMDFLQDPSSAYFRDNPIPKLVREVIQNSLDARDSGLAGPATVQFSEIRVDKDLIGGAELESHLQACLNRARDDKLDKARMGYQQALDALSSKSVRCLRVVDSGTTGLKEPNWDALVVQEGAVQKSGGGRPRRFIRHREERGIQRKRPPNRILFHPVLQRQRPRGEISGQGHADGASRPDRERGTPSAHRVL